MRRLNHEEGATAIIVAILLIVLFGFAALVIDVAALFWERRQLQNGADAAALAIAEHCATQVAACTQPVALDMADAYADANANDGAANAEIVDLDPLGSVTVHTSTRTTDGGNAIAHWFAPVLNEDFQDTTVHAVATVVWGAIAAGNIATVPLTFSWCEWEKFTDGQGVEALPTGVETIYFHTNNPNDCTGPAGQNVPGGFGWTGLDGTGTCTAHINQDQWVSSTSGSGSPTPADATGCDEEFFEGLIGQDILMPIFTDLCAQGGNDPDCEPPLPTNNKHYFIKGFAAFRVDGYRFGGSKPVYNPPCGNPDRCISGNFVDYFAYGQQPTSDPNDPFFGVTAARITE